MTWIPALLVAAALTFLGVFLLVRSLWGLRHDQEPRCSGCGYNLTALSSEQCPECGAPLRHATVVFGRRRRHPAGAIASALLLALGLTLGGYVAYSGLRNGNWNRYSPFILVLSNARSGSAVALQELQRRVEGNRLSAGQTDAVAEECLLLQTQAAIPANLGNWLNLLDRLDADGKLSPKQQQRYYAQLLSLELKVRPAIRPGDPLSVKLITTERGPANEAVRRKITHQELRIGQHLLPSGGSGGSPVTVGDESWQVSMQVPDLDPGDYSLHAKLRIEFTRHDRVLSSKEAGFSQPFKILPPGESGRVHSSSDPGLTETLARILHVEDVRLIPLGSSTAVSSQEPDRYRLQFSLCPAEPVPAALAFDVVLRANGQDLDVGKVSWKKGSWTWMSLMPLVPDLRGQQAHLILRANPDVVWSTVDQFEYWEGEVILGPIELPGGGKP